MKAWDINDYVFDLGPDDMPKLRKADPAEPSATVEPSEPTTFAQAAAALLEFDRETERQLEAIHQRRVEGRRALELRYSQLKEAT